MKFEHINVKENMEKKSRKPALVKIVLSLVLLLIAGFVGKSIYDKKEVLVYAFTHENKVAWLVEADRKAQADADLKVKESLSTLWIKE